MLSNITVEDKAAAFDALVFEFQGKARLVGMRRRIKEVETGPNESVVVSEDVPVYEFVMRVDGNDDFAAAVLSLLSSAQNKKHRGWMGDRSGGPFGPAD